jgi:hypothetical protein
MGMTMDIYRLTAAEAARLVALPPGPELDAALERIEQAAPWVGLGKSWDVIDRLLGGIGLNEGGTGVGEDLELGPARVFSPSGTVTMAGIVAAVDLDALLARWSPEAVSGIYPRSMGDPAHGPAMLRHWYPPFRAFLMAAADAGDGLLVEIV